MKKILFLNKHEQIKQTRETLRTLGFKTIVEYVLHENVISQTLSRYVKI